MKKKIIFILFCSACCAISFLSFKQVVFFIPKGWPKPVYNFSANVLTHEKIELGRMLFYDPILSRDNTVSCASCHSPYNAFAHSDHALSHGINDQTGTRNAPALMNLAWQKNFMWDGAIHHLDAQALAPLQNPKEMNETITHVIEKLQQSKKYKRLFFSAFHDSIITGEYFLKSIAQFMLTLVSANSKYDSVMREEAQFTEQEKNGFAVFRKHCNICHTAPLFSNYAFENNGLKPDPQLLDAGRATITLQKNDSFLFKVPSLRNVEFSGPYMHDGRFKKLSEVIEHYTSGIYHSPTCSKKLDSPIVLNEKDKIDLLAFLFTLTDKSFLFNPKHTFPREILSEN